MNTEDKVLAKVRKMMALANDERASEGERDNALRMAHALLAKHNLSMAQVETEHHEPRIFERFEGKSQPWTRSTAMAIAELFFCKYYFTRKGSYCVHNFIGRESNAVTARELAQYVIRSIMSEASRKSKAQTAESEGTYWTAFCKGAAGQVYLRCQELRKAAEAESNAAPTPTSTGTAIVLASLYRTEMDANAKALEDAGMKLRTVATRERNKGSDGYSAGREFGSKVSLSRQVQQKGTKYTAIAA